MSYINALVCLWVAYVAFAFMAHRHPPRLLKDMIMQGGLAVVFAFGVGAAYLPIKMGEPPMWWTVAFPAGLAMVATMLYDMQFGIAKHWALLKDWARRKLGIE